MLFLHSKRLHGQKHITTVNSVTNNWSIQQTPTFHGCTITNKYISISPVWGFGGKERSTTILPDKDDKDNYQHHSPYCTTCYRTNITFRELYYYKNNTYIGSTIYNTNNMCAMGLLITLVLFSKCNEIQYTSRTYDMTMT
jgi:hypothetical protein